MITKDTTLKELFDAACLSADTIVQSGEKFRVKDLFRGVEWSRIPKGLRTKLGAMFFAYVNGHGFPARRSRTIDASSFSARSSSPIRQAR